MRICIYIYTSPGAGLRSASTASASARSGQRTHASCFGGYRFEQAQRVGSRCRGVMKWMVNYLVELSGKNSPNMSLFIWHQRKVQKGP